MPILDVEIILKPGEIIEHNLARGIADAAAAIFGAGPGSTWVKVHGVDAAYYAENGAEPSDEVYPVFVSVLKARMPSPEDLRREVERLTPAIAALCQRPPENVHIIYLPEGAGRVAFGGRVVSG